MSVTSTRTLIFDGDINIFQSCAVNETEVFWPDDPDDDLSEEGVWTLHSDFDECKDHFDRSIEKVREDLEADDVAIVFSDTNRGRIFRKDVLPTYKENRKAARKPLAYWPLVDYVKRNYTVYERPNLEGDDVCGILATSNKIIKGEKIIVSIDKDVKTIPCNYYRMSHPDEGVVTVTEDEADWWHMFQTLTGDQTDGYKGCPGLGPKRAGPILEAALESGEPMWDAVVHAYAKAKLGEEEALVQARCARILRACDYDFKKKEPILWSP